MYMCLCACVCMCAHVSVSLSISPKGNPTYADTQQVDTTLSAHKYLSTCKQGYINTTKTNGMREHVFVGQPIFLVVSEL